MLNRYRGRVRSTSMAKPVSQKKFGDERLTRATAEKVFGWKSVRKRDGVLMGKKPDKAGRWRRARVPDYAGDQRFADAIDDRMEELGRRERYLKELSQLTRSQQLPAEWAAPEQRCRAALKALSPGLRLVRSGKNARG